MPSRLQAHGPPTLGTQILQVGRVLVSIAVPCIGLKGVFHDSRRIPWTHKGKSEMTKMPSSRPVFGEISKLKQTEVITV